MNKAILVIDMPNDCDECPLAVATTHDYDMCCIAGSRIISYGKFPWCPLRELPKRIINFGGDDDYADGYNDCLSEIIGE